MLLATIGLLFIFFQSLSADMHDEIIRNQDKDAYIQLNSILDNMRDDYDIIIRHGYWGKESISLDFPRVLKMNLEEKQLFIDFLKDRVEKNLDHQVAHYFLALEIPFEDGTLFIRLDGPGKVRTGYYTISASKNDMPISAKAFYEGGDLWNFVIKNMK